MLVDTLANRLNEALKIRKMKQIELSEKTGIPKSSINQYSKGTAVPKLDRMQAICKVLNVDGAYLLGYDVDINGNAKPKFNNILELDERFPYMSHAIGIAIQELRLKNGDTVEELANKLGRKVETMQEFEEGTELLPILTAYRICELYNYDDLQLRKDIIFQYNKLMGDIK